MALESALLCAFHHFSSLSVAFSTLKAIEAFPDAKTQEGSGVMFARVETREKGPSSAVVLVIENAVPGQVQTYGG